MTDTEMRAAYCLPIVDKALAQGRSILSTAQATIGTLEAAEKSRPLTTAEQQTLGLARLMLKGASLSSLEQARTRLSTYLMARGFLLAGNRDPFPVRAIARQAEQDWAVCGAEPPFDQPKLAALGQCTRKCVQGDAKCTQACVRANSPPICNKIDDCLNPDFLPF
jgi:hypothetical protein